MSVGIWTYRQQFVLRCQAWCRECCCWLWAACNSRTASRQRGLPADSRWCPASFPAGVSTFQTGTLLSGIQLGTQVYKAGVLSGTMWEKGKRIAFISHPPTMLTSKNYSSQIERKSRTTLVTDAFQWSPSFLTYVQHLWQGRLWSPVCYKGTAPM